MTVEIITASQKTFQNLIGQLFIVKNTFYSYKRNKSRFKLGEELSGKILLCLDSIKGKWAINVRVLYDSEIHDIYVNFSQLYEIEIISRQPSRSPRNR